MQTNIERITKKQTRKIECSIEKKITEKCKPKIWLFVTFSHERSNDELVLRHAWQFKSSDDIRPRRWRKNYSALLIKPCS